MFDILPPDIERLRVIRDYLRRQRTEAETIKTYLDVQLDLVEQRLGAAREAGPRPSPPAPSSSPQGDSAGPPPEGWAVEWRRTPEGGVPYRIHAATCIFAPKAGPRRAKLIDDHNARELLVGGVEPCNQCSPDVELGIDL